MSKTSGNADDQESSLIGNNSFPGYESMPAVNENAMPFTPHVRPPSIGNLYSSKNSQHNILVGEIFGARQRKRMSLTIDQVSNVTDDINGNLMKRSKNSKQNTTINNDNDKGFSYELHSCLSDDISLNNVTQMQRGQKDTLHQQQQKPQLLLGKSTPSLVSSLVTLPQSLPQLTILPSAAVAPAVSLAQSPHHNAAAAVVVAAAVVAFSSGFRSTSSTKKKLF
ncbi:unnamed protein product [Ceratitis capitata]|uniref:(Mediterranean fruit fly) hypothetical protein n=1 Tax=Ceratitis capitata TaxID=7213 RepID=A0A811US20_CERCA|nr:unnamed protein product [Ceratitis capitata]